MPRGRRRSVLRQISAHIAAAGAEQAEIPTPGTGPGGQGFGPRATDQPPHFTCSDLAGALAFFKEQGYVIFADALSPGQLTHINNFCDRTQRDDPEGWQIPVDGSSWTGARYSQPLLDTDELDCYTRLPSIFSFVSAVFGEGNERFSEFNLRDTPAGAGSMKMHFHHDAALPQRVLRKPYHPCDWLCSICYLTDVGADEPSFAVVPRSVRHEPIGRAKLELGADYVEQPLYGQAGTCVFYDIALYHTRLDSITGNDKRGRRTMHEYYSRGGYLDVPADPAGEWKAHTREPTPLLTNWVKIPERMAASPDPKQRLFFSHWNVGQCEWAALGFPPLERVGGNSIYRPVLPQ